MYRGFQGATALPAAVRSPDLTTGVPAIDVAVARGADGTEYFALVNVDPDHSASVEVAAGPLGRRRVSGQLLTAGQMDSRNRFGAAEEVRPQPFTGAQWSGANLRVAMPAKSIVVLTTK
jgi:alpha-N-arabinofuranosidase